MLYQTIVLQRIQDHPSLHEHLRQHRLVLAAVRASSTRLRSRHLELTQQLGQRSPGRNPEQTSQEALEIALEEFEMMLPEPESPTDPHFNLDRAVASLLEHSRAA